MRSPHEPDRVNLARPETGLEDEPSRQTQPALVQDVQNLEGAGAVSIHPANVADVTGIAPANRLTRFGQGQQAVGEPHRFHDSYREGSSWR